MRLTVVFVVGSGVMALLYIFSEHEIHRNNGFVRRYPHHPVELVRGYDLTYNSYYIAGFADGNVYLGNVTSPLDVVEIDTLLNNRKSFRIRLKGNADYPFSAVQIRIAPPYFFLSDGTVPIIYRGSMRDWVAHKYADGATRFSQWEVVDSTNIVVRSIDEDGNVVGLVGKDGKFKKGIGLLEKQVDGIFDTDGTLNYNESLKAIAYTYYYRNGFVTADTNFGNVYRGRTIDTVSRQHIKIVYEDSSRLQSMAKQPTQIQKFSYSSGRYLFTISDRLGKYEEEELLKDAVIVDVYDIINHTYEFSFYLYNYKNDRVRSFRVYNNLIVAMTQRHLVIYKMKQKEFDFSMSE
ncbi:MAG: hypothetical protein EOO51_13255 [Flavobacterium sp.]|nr:MAG: hypothetical protein EOO51_13255 [Flavobacterium sp.]